MSKINGNHLALAIQAIDFKIADLEKILDDLPLTQGSELELLLLSYTNTAEVFKEAYQDQFKISDNLPPYEKLVSSNKQ